MWWASLTCSRHWHGMQSLEGYEARIEGANTLTVTQMATEYPYRTLIPLSAGWYWVGLQPGFAKGEAIRRCVNGSEASASLKWLDDKDVYDPTLSVPIGDLGTLSVFLWMMGK